MYFFSMLSSFFLVSNTFFFVILFVLGIERRVSSKALGHQRKRKDQLDRTQRAVQNSQLKRSIKQKFPRIGFWH